MPEGQLGDYIERLVAERDRYRDALNRILETSMDPSTKTIAFEALRYSSEGKTTNDH